MVSVWQKVFHALISSQEIKRNIARLFCFCFCSCFSPIPSLPVLAIRPVRFTRGYTGNPGDRSWVRAQYMGFKRNHIWRVCIAFSNAIRRRCLVLMGRQWGCCFSLQLAPFFHELQLSMGSCNWILGPWHSGNSKGLLHTWRPNMNSKSSMRGTWSACDSTCPFYTWGSLQLWFWAHITCARYHPHNARNTLVQTWVYCMLGLQGTTYKVVCS